MALCLSTKISKEPNHSVYPARMLAEDQIEGTTNSDRSNGTSFLIHLRDNHGI